MPVSGDTSGRTKKDVKGMDETQAEILESKFEVDLAAEIVAWMRSPAVGCLAPLEKGAEEQEEEAVSANRLGELLHDGSALCRLANLLIGDGEGQAGFKLQPKETSVGFLQMENIGRYLGVCSDVCGVADGVLFDVVELYERQNMPKVLVHLDFIRRHSDKLKQTASRATAPKRLTTGSTNKQLYGSTSRSPQATRASGSVILLRRTSLFTCSGCNETSTVDRWPKFCKGCGTKNEQPEPENLVSSASSPASATSSPRDVGAASVASLEEDLRAKEALKHNPELERMARGWIAAVVGPERLEAEAGAAMRRMKKAGVALAADNIVPLDELLRSGVLLCHVVNEIEPSVKRIHTSDIAFQHIENCASYLEAGRKIGLSQGERFDPSDLVEMKNFNLVVANIHALARVAAHNDRYKAAGKPLMEAEDTSKTRSLFSALLVGDDMAASGQLPEPESTREADLVEYVNRQLEEVTSRKGSLRASTEDDLSLEPRIANLGPDLRDGEILLLLADGLLREDTVSATTPSTPRTMRPQLRRGGTQNALESVRNHQLFLRRVGAAAGGVDVEVQTRCSPRDLIAGNREAACRLIEYVRDKFDPAFLFEQLLAKELSQGDNTSGVTPAQMAKILARGDLFSGEGGTDSAQDSDSMASDMDLSVSVMSVESDFDSGVDTDDEEYHEIAERAAREAQLAKEALRDQKAAEKAEFKRQKQLKREADALKKREAEAAEADRKAAAELEAEELAAAAAEREAAERAEADVKLAAQAAAEKEAARLKATAERHAAAVAKEEAEAAGKAAEAEAAARQLKRAQAALKRMAAEKEAADIARAEREELQRAAAAAWRAAALAAKEKRLERERVAAAEAARRKEVQEKEAAEKLAASKIASEKAAADKAAAAQRAFEAKAAADKANAEKHEAQRRAAAKAAAERAALEKAIEAERAAAEEEAERAASAEAERAGHAKPKGSVGTDHAEKAEAEAEFDVAVEAKPAVAVTVADEAKGAETERSHKDAKKAERRASREAKKAKATVLLAPAADDRTSKRSKSERSSTLSKVDPHKTSDKPAKRATETSAVNKKEKRSHRSKKEKLPKSESARSGRHTSRRHSKIVSGETTESGPLSASLVSESDSPAVNPPERIHHDQEEPQASSTSLVKSAPTDTGSFATSLAFEADLPIATSDQNQQQATPASHVPVEAAPGKSVPRRAPQVSVAAEAMAAMEEKRRLRRAQFETKKNQLKLDRQQDAERKAAQKRLLNKPLLKVGVQRASSFNPEQEKIERAQSAVRQKIVAELLSTEETFVQSLLTLDAFRKRVEQTKALSDEERRVVFSSLPDISACHTRLLAAIRSRLGVNSAGGTEVKLGSPALDAGDGVAAIADLIMHNPDWDIPAPSASLATFLEVAYQPYIHGYAVSAASLHFLVETNKAFAALVREFEEQQLSLTRLPLDGFLIVPVQRLPRYIMLLRDMQKYTPARLVEHSRLGDAIAFVDQKLKAINGTIDQKQIEGLQRTLAVARSIGGAPTAVLKRFVQPERKLLHEGLVEIGVLLPVDMYALAQAKAYVPENSVRVRTRSSAETRAEASQAQHFDLSWKSVPKKDCTPCKPGIQPYMFLYDDYICLCDPLKDSERVGDKIFGFAKLINTMCIKSVCQPDKLALDRGWESKEQQAQRRQRGVQEPQDDSDPAMLRGLSRRIQLPKTWRWEEIIVLDMDNEGISLIRAPSQREAQLWLNSFLLLIMQRAKRNIAEQKKPSASAGIMDPTAVDEGLPVAAQMKQLGAVRGALLRHRQGLEKLVGFYAEKSTPGDMEARAHAEAEIIQLNARLSQCEKRIGLLSSRRRSLVPGSEPGTRANTGTGV